MNFLLKFFVASAGLLCLGACSDSASPDGEKDYTIVLKESVAFTESDCCKSEISAEEVLKLVSASQVKIVLRDDVAEDLVLADFSGDSSKGFKFVNLNTGISAYHPEISPDGNWVAFGKSMESSDKDSKLYVQNLNDGRLLQLDVEKATVPRWHVLDGTDTVIVYESSGGLTQHSQWKNYSTWVVSFTDGKFGTPKKIMNGGFVGVTDDYRFAVAGGADFIVRKMNPETQSYKDTIWYNKEQVCNLSIAKDSSLRTSFLDLRGAEGLEFVGSPYGAHCRLFVVDSLGKLIQAVPSPEGFAFDHTEWISQGEFQVATLQDLENDLAHNKLALINMVDESVTLLASGKEMFHPCFWLKK